MGTFHYRRVAAGMVLLPVVALALLWFLARQSAQRMPQFQRPDAAYLAAWRAVTLAPISPTEAFREKLSQQPIETDVPLSDLQQERLRQAAFQFLVAFSTGSFEDYGRFRFPIRAGTYDPQLLQFDLELLARHGIPQVPADKPVDLLFARWRTGLLNICTNCWREAGLQSASLTARRSPALPGLLALTNLAAYSRAADSSSLQAFRPRFQFQPTPEEVALRDGAVVHALFWVVIRDRADPQPYPVFGQWYWDEASKHWLPSLVGIGDVRDAKYSLLF